MTWLRTALWMVTASMVASCATGYGARGLGGGYSDEKLDESHYRVKFDGNGYAGKDRVWSFWMYRCAELTKSKGYAYFTIQRPGEAIGRASPMPGVRQAAYTVGDTPRLIQTKGGGYAPIYIPGGTVTSWHTDAVVAMFNEELPEDVWVLRADSVMQALSVFVKTDGSSGAVGREDVFRRAATVKPSERGYRFAGAL